MVDEKKDLNTDDDFDDGLDTPDLSMEGGDHDTNSRSVIQRGSKGFLEGARSSILQQSALRRAVSSALPPGYVAAFEIGEQALDSGRELYDAAADNLKPAKSSLKKIGRKLADKSEGYVPAAVQDKLREISQEEKKLQDKQQPTKEQLQESEMETALADIFQKQRRDEVEREEREHAQKVTEEATDQARHEQTSSQLDTIRGAVSRLVGYQDTILHRYQQQSLKMQYRQYFVSANQYTLLQGFVQENRAQLNAISNNTALPEYAKITTSEYLKGQAASNLAESALGGAGGFIRNFAEKAKGRVSDLSSRFTEGVRGAADGMDMAEDIPIDKAEMGGNMAGSMAGDYGLNKLARKAGKVSGKIPGVNRLGDQLDYYSTSGGDVVRDFVNREASRGDSFDASVTDKGRSIIGRFLQEMMPRYSPEETVGSGIEGMQEAVPYTEHANRSIVEVIPNLLSEILRETEMIRTGDENVERRRFDYGSNRLERESTTQSNLRERIIPKRRVDQMQKEIGDIIDRIDPDGNLDSQTRNALLRQLIQDASSGRGFQIERLARDEGLGTVEDEGQRQQIQQQVQSQYLDEEGKFRGTDQNYRDRATSARQYRSAQAQIPSYQETIKELLPIYGAEQLEQMGLLRSAEKTGRAPTGQHEVDVESISAMMAGGVNRQSTARASAATAASRSQVTHDDLQLETGPLASTAPAEEPMVESSGGIIDAIRSISPRGQLRTANEWLQRIYSVLSGGTPPSGPTGTDPSSGGPSPQENRTTIGDRLRGASQWAQAQGGRAWEQGQQMAGTARERTMRAGDYLQEQASAYYEPIQGRMQQAQEATRASVTDIRNRSSALADQAQTRMGGMMRSVSGSDVQSAAGSGMGPITNVQPVDGEMGTVGQQDPANQSNYGGMVRQGLDQLNQGLELIMDRFSIDGRRGGGSGGGSGGPGGPEGPSPEEQAQSRHQELIQQIQTSTQELQQTIATIAAVSDADVGEQASSQRGVSMLRRVGRRVGSGMGGIMSFYGNSFRSMGLVGLGAGRAGAGVLGGVGDRLRGMIGGKRGGGNEEAQSENVQDIYMAGYSQPVLKARDLRQGRYLSAESGEPIQTLEDIDGAVVDLEGNYVLTESEVSSGELYTKNGKPLSSIVGGALSGLGSYIGAPYQAAWSIVTGAASKIRSIYNGPLDVYVRGEDTPRLLAVIMRNGGYFNRTSQEPIYKVSDIDDEVIDRQGQVVLSADDMRHGLVNSRGKAIKGMAEKAKDLAKAGLRYSTLGFRLGAKAIGAAGRGAKSAMDRLRGRGGGGDGSEGGDITAAHEGAGEEETIFHSIYQENRTQSTHLTDIVSLIDQRIPSAEDKETRKGRWQDSVKGPKADEVKDVEHTDRGLANKDNGLIKKALSGLMSVVGSLGGVVSTIAGALGIGAGANWLKDRLTPGSKKPGGGKPGKPSKAGKAGKAGKIGRFLKGGGKMLGRVAAAAAPYALSYAGTAASTLGTAAAGVGSVLASPVVLTVGAVAAAGVGAYFTYKYFSSGNTTPIDRFRVAQYGYDIDNEEHEDSIKRMAALEKNLYSKVTIQGKNKAKLTGQVDYQKLLEELGIDPNDNRAVERWLTWMKARFLPVFLSHVAVADSMKGTKNLQELDLSHKEQRDFLNRVRFPDDEGPYQFIDSPFGDVSKLLGPTSVNNAYENALQEIDKAQQEKQKRKEKHDRIRRNTGPGQGYRQAQAEAEAEDEKKTDPTTKDKDGKSKSDTSDTDFSSIGGGTGITVPDGAGEGDDAKSDPKESRDQREKRVARQTSTQIAKKSEQMSERMNDLVDVMRKSYGVQKDTYESLTRIEKLLYKQHELKRLEELKAQEANGELSSGEKSELTKMQKRQLSRLNGRANQGENQFVVVQMGRN